MAKLKYDAQKVFFLEIPVKKAPQPIIIAIVAKSTIPAVSEGSISSVGSASHSSKGFGGRILNPGGRIGHISTVAAGALE